MAQVRLQLENWGYLDVIDEVVMPLNYNFNDIINLTNRGGVWSKTIELPGTNHNNDILGQVFNVNTNTLTFNPKRKERIRISVDGFNHFDGIFQLRKVRKKYITNEDFKIIYDCYIKSESSSFYSEISGKFLDELAPLLNTSNGTQYPVIDFNESVIQDSMVNGDVSYGYQFYLPYATENFYTPAQMIPGIYAKVIWDNIFFQSDYEYEWDELEEVDFDKMIITHQGGELKPYDDAQYEMRAGIQTKYIREAAFLSYTNVPTVFNDISQYNFVIGNNLAVKSAFDDDFTSQQGWFDNNNSYNTDPLPYVSAFEYTLPENYTGELTLESKFNHEIIITYKRPIWALTNTASIILKPGWYTDDTPVKWKIKKVHYGRRLPSFINPSGIFEILNEEIIEIEDNQAFSGLGVPSGFSTIFVRNFLTITDTLTTTLNTNDLQDVVSVGTALYIEIDGFWWAIENPDGPYSQYPSLYDIDVVQLPSNDEDAHFSVKSNNFVGYNTQLPIETLIPKKIKQTDFILSIIKMFNLYVIQDPIQENKLIFKSRDTFYSEGEELDWTEKIDIRSVDIELISNRRKKTTDFTHKQDDKDALLKAYDDNTQEVYGQLEYILENDFIKDTETIETIFSPAVAIDIFNRQTPYIDNLIEKNIKIMYVGDILQGYWSFYNGYGNLPENFFTNDYYRYVGHFYPNQNEPIKDLNFGICDFYAHNRKYITDNNLYNRFYRTQMDIIENGHIMTAYFNLTYPDVKNLKFNERIYVYDSWWNINKIIDFDINNKKLTKVELITSDKTIGDFIPNHRIINLDNFSNVGNTLNEASQENKVDNTISVNVGKTEIIGVDNTIQGESTTNFILGDRNKIKGTNLLIQGQENKVNGNNITVLGLNKGIFTDDDTVYTGTLIKQVHFIDAGRDNVLDKYPENKVINMIDGGRDEVRPYGSFSIESVIDGGRDRV